MVVVVEAVVVDAAAVSGLGKHLQVQLEKRPGMGITGKGLSRYHHAPLPLLLPSIHPIRCCCLPTFVLPVYLLLHQGAPI